MNLQKLSKQGVSYSDIVAELKAEYPKMTKSTLAMAAHPEEYGVKLLPKCEAAIKAKYLPPPAPKPKPSAHRITISLDNEAYTALTVGSNRAKLTVSGYISAILKGDACVEGEEEK